MTSGRSRLQAKQKRGFAWRAKKRASVTYAHMLYNPPPPPSNQPRDHPSRPKKASECKSPVKKKDIVYCCCCFLQRDGEFFSFRTLIFSSCESSFFFLPNVDSHLSLFLLHSCRTPLLLEIIIIIINLIKFIATVSLDMSILYSGVESCQGCEATSSSSNKRR
jgi:hypothetical protein